METEPPKDSEELARFKMDVAKFSGQYAHFLIIAMDPEKRLFWKSSDVTWAVGAAMRYMVSIDERDRHDERGILDGLE